MTSEISNSQTAAVAVTAIVSKSASLAATVRVGHYTLIDPDDCGGTTIGEDSSVGSHAMIEQGVTIGKRCVIDHYCRICMGTTIGDDTRILYGAAVFENVSIGKKCIVGGNVADRTFMEDFVTYFGEIAHDYRIPGNLDAWDGDERPSPIVRSRSVVGQNALLIGGVEIGEGSYVAAGETVRCNVPPAHIFVRGRLLRLAQFKGLIQARTDD